MCRAIFCPCLLAALSLAQVDDAHLPQATTTGQIELVATFTGAMPTGVTVSHRGRIFVNFPRWGDPVEFTVAEWKGGQAIPYPDAGFNRFNPDHPAQGLVSVQSVVVDPADRLWLLDTGSINFGPTIPGGPRLIGVDLETNRVFKTISFPEDVVLKTTYLNDVRFDLRQGQAGVAYITDSALKGPNALIVVDLATGRSWRRLHNHSSTQADKKFQPLVEGRPLLNRPRDGQPSPLSIGADGIAISHDGRFIYYCALASRRLYRVPTNLLLDEKTSAEVVAKGVEFLGERGFASDGLESDQRGRLYLTNYEDNGILRRNADGSYETLVHDPRVLWPDTLALAKNGYLYFTANQLHRQPQFHNGKDLRQRPYALFRLKVDAGPVLLTRSR